MVSWMVVMLLLLFWSETFKSEGATATAYFTQLFNASSVTADIYFDSSTPLEWIIPTIIGNTPLDDFNYPFYNFSKTAFSLGTHNLTIVFKAGTVDLRTQLNLDFFTVWSPVPSVNSPSASSSRPPTSSTGSSLSSLGPNTWLASSPVSSDRPSTSLPVPLTSSPTSATNIKTIIVGVVGAIVALCLISLSVAIYRLKARQIRGLKRGVTPFPLRTELEPQRKPPIPDFGLTPPILPPSIVETISERPSGRVKKAAKRVQA